MGSPSTLRGRSVAKNTALRSVAHRFAGACGRNIADIMVLGIRYDDDEPSKGDTLVVRLRPGQLDAVSALSGPARAIACFGDELVVVDDRGVLRSLNQRLGTVEEAKLDRVIDLFEDGEGVSCAVSPPVSRLLALREGGEVVDVITGLRVLHVPGGTSIRGGAVVTPDAVFGLNGSRLHEGAVDVACACVGHFAWSKSKTLVVDDRPFLLAHPAQALCFAFGRCFIGSQMNGLWVVDDEGLRSLRPSLRAHGLSLVNDGLLVVSDLMVATSDDGIDFISRDLATYVRLAEQRSEKQAQKSPPLD